MVRPVLRIDALRELDIMRRWPHLVQRLEDLLAPQAGAPVVDELEVRVQQRAGGVEVDEPDADVVENLKPVERVHRTHDEFLKRLDEFQVCDP